MRSASIVLIALVLVIVGVGFYKGSFYEEFRMKGLKSLKLSKDKVAEVSGYERRESENGVPKYFIKADRASTFSDNHQELENVYLKLFFNGSETEFDQIAANKAIYIPARDGTKNFKIFFAGDVRIETRDSLIVESDQLSYNKATDIAESEFEVNFQRKNISGNSYGVVVDVGKETLQLLRDVEVYAYADGGENEFSQTDLATASVSANFAFIDQKKETIDFSQDVKIALTPKKVGAGIRQDTDIEAARALVYMNNRELEKINLNGAVYIYQKPGKGIQSWSKIRANRAVAIIDQELVRVELTDNVSIESTTNSSTPTTITGQYATYTKANDTFEVDGGVKINSSQDSKPTEIRSNRAIYQQSRGIVNLNGNAVVTQDGNTITGERIDAQLYPDRSLKEAYVFWGAHLTQKTDERTTDVTSNSMVAKVDENGNFASAKAVGNARAVVIPVSRDSFTKIDLRAGTSLDLAFRKDGSLDVFDTKGRTTIALDSPNNSPDSSNKTLTADKIRTKLSSNGNEIKQASAVGNAELNVVPLRSSKQNYKSTVRANRFDCDFYAKNNARSCKTSGRTTVIRRPTVSGLNQQTLVANRLVTTFNEQTQDVKTFDAVGKAKFSEGNRNGTSDRISYTASDGIVKFRGGEPTIWDSAARAKASSIDWDTKANRSVLVGGVATTYYSARQAGGATPFSNVNSPVFVTAEQAAFDHDDESAVYQGNARAWQDDNYVRGDRILVSRKTSSFFAEGNVQSMLFDVARTNGGKRQRQPVSASADKMFYSEKDNVIRYVGNVDIRQGKDRIRAGKADVYLSNDYELKQTIFEENVKVSQPGRNASGDYARYNVPNETVLLRGSPARVSDVERGATQARELLVYLNEKRVESSGSTRNLNGRQRTVYKIKNGKIN